MTKHPTRHTSDIAHGSIVTYVAGFVLSVALTLIAFALVDQPGSLSRGGLMGLILGLAATQLIVQLVFFLHLGRESKPRWNLMLFLFMTLMLGILVFGSLWVMENLNYHGMDDPKKVEMEIIQDEGIR